MLHEDLFRHPWAFEKLGRHTNRDAPQESPTGKQYPEGKVLSYLKQVNSWMLSKLFFVIAFFDDAAFCLEGKKQRCVIK